MWFHEGADGWPAESWKPDYMEGDEQSIWVWGGIFLSMVGTRELAPLLHGQLQT
jgi:hypothetical protein